ncbi:hypothetical protein CLIB1423_01S01992 [[Candida] railenensis]|uniref:Uncharacterized protein n=1 Tax=[Candida] railenensis TaxID=45579 RepID=A0A9P0VVL4_9ASCO|nr:hypothetical protein CLIB1423_01S01992 [[Candida] railenensis]
MILPEHLEEKISDFSKRYIYYGNYNSYYSPWNSYGRWILTGVIILAFIIAMLIYFFIRRRRMRSHTVVSPNANYYQPDPNYGQQPNYAQQPNYYPENNGYYGGGQNTGYGGEQRDFANEGKTVSDEYAPPPTAPPAATYPSR